MTGTGDVCGRVRGIPGHHCAALGPLRGRGLAKSELRTRVPPGASPVTARYEP